MTFEHTAQTGQTDKQTPSSNIDRIRRNRCCL